MTMITSKITEIGEDAFFEGYPILILFNDTAPEGIREVSIIHTFETPPNKEMLVKGSKIYFADQEYTVEDIGYVANETLYDLGHVSLYFGLEEGTELLPGSAKLHPYTVPTIKVGDVIKFVK